MAVFDPGTRSPGFLAIVYVDQDQEHICSVRFINGIDINAITAIRADAVSLANVIKGVLPVSRIITGWRILNPQRRRLYEEAFTPTIAGSHASSGVDWRSSTITVTGKGAAVDLSSGSGQTRLEIFIGNSFQPARGQKFFLASQDITLTALFNNLNTNLRYFADFFGQHADARAQMPFQWNAHAQRRIGS